MLVHDADTHRVAVRTIAGARVIDCGLDVPGGLEAGMAMAETCLGGLGRVSVVPHTASWTKGPAVCTQTDQPMAACMASQYAGWQIAADGFFAMGSGPMRAAARKEKLFEQIGYVETAPEIIGILETSKLPPEAICEQIANDCGVPADKLTLLVAPTASLAGTIQVVARSVETALHKMHEVGFDLSRVVSGFGSAPLPPVAADDLTGIGRTNDAVLYGGEVTLWVRGDDDSLNSIGPRIPSSASADYGRPFKAIFESYDRDFYKIDPLLFSPAVVTLMNIDSGGSFQFGETRPEVLSESFQGM